MNLLEIKLKNDSDFLKIRETLTRIGISTKDGRLIQTAHILHKRGKYYIVHFKEMFALDKRIATLTDEDISRRNAIAKLLEDWGLLTIVSDYAKINLSQELRRIRIVQYRDKKNWKLLQKYHIGIYHGKNTKD